MLFLLLFNCHNSEKSWSSSVCDIPSHNIPKLPFVPFVMHVVIYLYEIYSLTNMGVGIFYLSCLYCL